MPVYSIYPGSSKWVTAVSATTVTAPPVLDFLRIMDLITILSPVFNTIYRMVDRLRWRTMRPFAKANMRATSIPLSIPAKLMCASCYMKRYFVELIVYFCRTQRTSGRLEADSRSTSAAPRGSPTPSPRLVTSDFSHYFRL